MCEVDHLTAAITLVIQVLQDEERKEQAKKELGFIYQNCDNREDILGRAVALLATQTIKGRNREEQIYYFQRLALANAQHMSEHH